MNNLALSCPIPANEAKRLEAVRSYEILDTSPEVDFDALTRLAAHTFGTPAAVIGLMDADRLWFKSRLGLDVPQLDRQIAFCAHAIMRHDELLVVDDLQKDPRFENNPLVTQPPHLRFYAGAPLIDRNGFALGTIAVADTKARTLSETKHVLLWDMATLVISVLENRHRANQLSYLAMTDYLTGLANRVQFERTLNSEMAHSRRTGEIFTVFLMDLNDFKAVNDTFGHAAGDEVLCEATIRMTKQIRTEDLLARFGGDEFALFIRQSEADTVDSLARRIVDAVSAPITLSTGEKVSVGISVGIAKFTESIDSIYTLLAQADQALYIAKRRN